MRETGAAIVAEVAERYGVTVAALKDKAKWQPIARIRQEAMYEMYIRCPHLSLPDIGRILGGRDHTTIMHGVQAHCKRIGVSYEQTRNHRHKDRVLAPHVFHAFAEAMKRAA